MNLIGINALTLSLSAAVSAHVISSFKDSGADDIDGRNAKITESTTETTIIAAPGSGRRRRITDLHIRAPIDNAAPATFTLKQSDGTTSWEVFSAVLRPGDCIVYDHTRGWSVLAQALIGNGLVDVLHQLFPNTLLI